MELIMDIKKTRFDTRLTYAQKELFEKARRLGGYRTLTDFVLSALQEKAEKIIQEEEIIIASNRDAQIFTEAITNPNKPNEALTNAFNKHYKAND